MVFVVCHELLQCVLDDTDCGWNSVLGHELLVDQHCGMSSQQTQLAPQYVTRGHFVNYKHTVMKVHQSEE